MGTRLYAIVAAAAALLVATTPTWAEDGLPGGPALTPYGKRLLEQAGILGQRAVSARARKLNRVGGITIPQATEAVRAGGSGRLESPLLKPPGGRRVVRKIVEPPPLPKDAPPVRFNRRHELDRLELFTGRRTGAGRTAYLLEPLHPKELDRLYREAIAIGPLAGSVVLQNGQTWHIDAATGRFFPLSGPGIVTITSAEARFLQDLKRAITMKKKAPREALLALDRASRLVGYSFSRDMAWALARAGGSLGFTDAEVAASLGARIRTGLAEQKRREVKARAKTKMRSAGDQSDDDRSGDGNDDALDPEIKSAPAQAPKMEGESR